MLWVDRPGSDLCVFISMSHQADGCVCVMKWGRKELLLRCPEILSISPGPGRRPPWVEAVIGQSKGSWCSLCICLHGSRKTGERMRVCIQLCLWLSKVSMKPAFSSALFHNCPQKGDFRPCLKIIDFFPWVLHKWVLWWLHFYNACQKESLRLMQMKWNGKPN